MWSSWSCTADLADDLQEELKYITAAKAASEFGKSLDKDLLDYLFTMVVNQTEFGELADNLIEVSDMSVEETKKLCEWLADQIKSRTKVLSDQEKQVLELRRQMEQLEADKKQLEMEKRQLEEDRRHPKRPKRENEDLSKLSVDRLYYKYLSTGFNGDFFQYQELATEGIDKWSAANSVLGTYDTASSSKPAFIKPQEFVKKTAEMNWSRTPPSTKPRTSFSNRTPRGGHTAHMSYVKPGLEIPEDKDVKENSMTWGVTPKSANMSFVNPNVKSSQVWGSGTVTSTAVRGRGRGVAMPFRGHQQWVRPDLVKNDSLSESLPPTP